jgi:putative endonuclease
VSRDRRAKLGILGEAAAVEELKRRGYVVLARNYRCRGGEADAVAEHGEDLVFVEVKTRTSLTHGLPRESVRWSKQQRLQNAALHYCFERDIEDRPIRFDVVEVVVLNGEIAAIELIADAFVPD